ncbi:MAG: hypothetical protein ABW133_15515 [Polyangiaceae bacterium]
MAPCASQQVDQLANFEIFGEFHERLGDVRVLGRMAIEAHGGCIGVDPGDPEGSVFWFEIPAQR